MACRETFTYDYHTLAEERESMEKNRNAAKSFVTVVLIMALMTIMLTGVAQSPEETWRIKIEKREGVIEAKPINKLEEAVFKDFEIDKGAQDGLVEGDIVFGPNSLIGKLSQVKENTALVETIGPDESINHSLVTKERPENLNVVYENIGKNLSATYIFPKTKLDHGSVGDAVYTTSSDGGYPEGLFLGFVADHKLAEVPEGVWAVRLPVDIRYLETVYIYHVN